MSATKKEIRKIVGISENNTLVILDYAYEYSDGFKGCVGMEMSPLTQKEIDDANSENYIRSVCKELWQQAVSLGEYEDGLDQFIEEYKDNMEGLFPGDDDSWRDLTEGLVKELPESDQKTIEDELGEYATWSCSSFGRIFDGNGIKFKKIFDPEVLTFIKKAMSKCSHLEGRKVS